MYSMLWTARSTNKDAYMSRVQRYLARSNDFRRIKVPKHNPASQISPHVFQEPNYRHVAGQMPASDAPAIGGNNAPANKVRPNQIGDSTFFQVLLVK
ncbi:hypothetical protein FVE85_3427 [Porphyridium purpureum]|uniref:Uncharacterized protein n=1 Tax=Porphyridium purpureum TaxID=35688 RepID=A0A5J4YV06_PORPP|nr:hypothetical protein FVE85_3427 [Porphyridium purpureum]|eukprot:POR8066..scf227_4